MFIIMKWNFQLINIFRWKFQVFRVESAEKLCKLHGFNENKQNNYYSLSKIRLDVKLFESKWTKFYY
jgi:hypothetical protein